MQAQASASNVPVFKIRRKRLDLNFRRWPYLFVASFAFWTIPALFKCIQLYFEYLAIGAEIKPLYFLSVVFGEWYYWAFVTPLIFFVGYKFPLGKSYLRTIAFIYFPVGILIAALHVIQITLTVYIWWSERVPFRTVFIVWLSNFTHYLLFYMAILGCKLFSDYYRRYKESELEAANLQIELSQAQLHALRMQINPHFLFNTLNSISALMYEDLKAANLMLVRLSELLRMTLSQDTVQEILLVEELGFLQGYLGIEQVRFQDRLTVNLDIPPETMKAYVPSLILQPLVENSIKHCVSKRRGRSLIEVRARRLAGEKLLLEVRDKGLGLTLKSKSSLAVKEGVGLSNIRNRLQRLYEGEHRFKFSNSGQGGAKVSITIPYRTDISEECVSIHSYGKQSTD